MHLHVWTVTSGFDALSCHLMIDDLAKSPMVLKRSHDVLTAEFDIRHSTIQIEFPRRRRCRRAARNVQKF